GDDAIDAADIARLDANGIVGDVEVGLFREAMPFNDEQEILRPERLAGTNDTREQIVEHRVPDLAPCFAARTSERVRMLGAEDRPVCVVVQAGEIKPPEENEL